MDGLEVLSDKKNCYFVDLFVRVSNKATQQPSMNSYSISLCQLYKTAEFREAKVTAFFLI